MLQANRARYFHGQINDAARRSASGGDILHHQTKQEIRWAIYCARIVRKGEVTVGDWWQVGKIIDGLNLDVRRYAQDIVHAENTKQGYLRLSSWMTIYINPTTYEDFGDPQAV